MESVSIVIPAFNEEETVELVAKQALLELKKVARDYELVLVDDGSTDKTGKILDGLAEKNKRIRVIHHKKNKGFTGAMKTCFGAASKDLVLLAPADGQFDFSEMKKFTQAIKGYDVVAGYRINNPESYIRKLNSKAFHFFCKTLLGIKLKEFSTILLFRKKVLEAVEIESDESAALALPELLYKAQKQGFKFTGVGFSFQKRKGGKPKGAKLTMMIKTLKEIFFFWLKENKIFAWLFVFLAVWDLAVFVYFPKMAWMQGLVEAWYTSKGLKMYRDYVGFYGPFLRLLMYPLHRVFGFSQQVTIILFLVNSLLILGLLAYLSLRWLKGWYRFIPLVFYEGWNVMVAQNHFSTNTFLALVILLLVAIWLEWWEEPSKMKAFWIGLISSVVILSNHANVLILIVIGFSLLYKSWHEPKNRLMLAVYLLALTAPLLGFLIWLIRSEIFIYFFEWSFVYFFKENPNAKFGRSQEDLVVFFSAYSALVLVPVYWLIGNKERMKRVLIGLLLIALPLTYWFVDFYITRFATALPLFAFFLGYLLQSVLVKKNWVVVGGVSVILMLNGYSWVKYALPKYKASFLDPTGRVLTRVGPSDPAFDVVSWVKENTGDEARLYVMADAYILMLTDRLPANIWGTTNLPNAYFSMGRLRSDIESSPPDYWVIDERQWKRFDVDFGYPEYTEFYQKLFECEPEVARFEYMTIRKHPRNSLMCF